LVANVAQIRDSKAPSSSVLTPLAPINSSGSPGTSSDKLIVEWNKEMSCDGEVVHFVGQPDKNGNRVRTLYQTQSLWCDLMEIHLNRKFLFFDDTSNVELQASIIQCAHDVYVRNRQIDVSGKQKSIETAQFALLRYYVNKNYIAAEGPGEMTSTFLGSGQGFPGVKTEKTGSEEKLNYLAIWFQDTVTGTLLGSNKTVDINGRVMAAYCPAASWDDTIQYENFAAARKTGYTLECEQLKLAQAPNPDCQGQGSVELTASGDALIDSSSLYGKAQTIKYNQAKNVVNFDGNVKIHTTINGQRSDHGAATIQYNIETGSVNYVQAQGLSIGQ
jgi:hypothetical protein